jgi:hypothetical protein
MTTPLPATWWSIKDIIAHIAWHEQQTAAVLQPYPGRGLVRDWLWLSTPTKRNAILFTESQNRSLPEVRAAARQVFVQMVAAVEALTEKDLRDARRFPDIPPAWQPWSFIAGHSYEHYREHTPGIRAWLDTLGLGPAKIVPRAVVAGAHQATQVVALAQPRRDQQASIMSWEEEGGHV